MGNREISFGPFRLDCDNQQLWRSERQLSLPPKPLAVLQYLVENAGRLITKEELLQQVWAGVQVTPKALTVCIHAIRAILGDSEAPPQFIETQGKQGYRFIAPLSIPPPVLRAESQRQGQPLTAPLVGREKELAQLQAWYAAASAGACQLVFVSGEAGIGKTTLVNLFLASLRTRGQVWIGAGQCVQHHGAIEAYLPVLAALSQFARGAGQAELRAALRQYAPSWMARVPALGRERGNEPPSDPLHVVTPHRLMWELTEALRALVARRPMVLVFEDLHWSDTATMDWLAYLAQQREPLRLLIIGTYRPSEVIASGHPLHAITHELGGKRQSAELRPELLTKQQVQDYFTRRFPGSTLPARLILLIHQRTDGNPLFMVRLVEHLVRHGFLLHSDGRWRLTKPVAELDGEMPDELQGMIERQVEQLSEEEQRVLDVASVVGEAFAAAVVAAGMSLPAVQVEAVCDELARKQQVIERRGIEEWPDETITACYGFQHALFREAVYRRLGDGRRLRLHRALAERLEAGYGERAREIASKLAGHWTQGRDYHKGATYQLHAADNALRLSVYREAITYCQQGLELLAHVSATPERDRQELAIRMSLHMALGAVSGLGVQEVEENLRQALKLARKVKDEQTLVTATVALGRVYITRSDRAGALRSAEEDARLLEQVRDQDLSVLLHIQLGTIHTFRAEYTQARAHITQVQNFYTTAEHESLIFATGLDPLIAVYSLSNLGLWLAGWPDQSRQHQHNLVARGAQLLDKFFNLYAYLSAAMAASLRGDLAEARQLVDQSTPIATQSGSAMYLAMGMIVQGCLAVRSGDLETGITTLKKALPDYRATSARSLLSVFLSFLAEGLSRCGKSEEAFATLAEALKISETSLEVYWEAELYRVKGELLLNAERGTQNDERKTKKKGRASSPTPQ